MSNAGPEPFESTSIGQEMKKHAVKQPWFAQKLCFKRLPSSLGQLRLIRTVNNFGGRLRPFSGKRSIYIKRVFSSVRTSFDTVLLYAVRFVRTSKLSRKCTYTIAVHT
jgi:hypothetical protein